MNDFLTEPFPCRSLAYFDDNVDDAVRGNPSCKIFHRSSFYDQGVQKKMDREVVAKTSIPATLENSQKDTNTHGAISTEWKNPICQIIIHLFIPPRRFFPFLLAFIQSDNCKFSPIKPQIYLIETPKHFCWLGCTNQFSSCIYLFCRLMFHLQIMKPKPSPFTLVTSGITFRRIAHFVSSSCGHDDGESPF